MPPADVNLETSSPALQAEHVAFTGTLASMTHAEACELVAEHGGTAAGHVSRQTTMLVIGEEGWPLEADGRPSQKLEQVDEHRRHGADVRILNETEWLRLLSLEEREREVHRLYTPAMLSRLLDVSTAVIRRWARDGLIRPVRRVHRLPYFDYQEVAGARRLHELLEQGVPTRVLKHGLEDLRKLLPHVERPLAQLDVLASGSRVYYVDDRGLVDARRGQRLFSFGSPDDDASSESADDEDAPVAVQFRPSDAAGDPDHAKTDSRPLTVEGWFHAACAALEAGDVDDAVEAFRVCLMERPGDAELNFHLAEALYREGNVDAAIERSYAAVEADHEYIEAWVQLGSLFEDRDRLDDALEAFTVALTVHPDYPDAHLRRAEVLHRLDRTEEAVAHWRRYLEFDERGPWADAARQRLEEDGG